MPAHHGALKGATAPVAAAHDDDAWRSPVLLTVASKGEGIGELVAALDRHWDWMTESGELLRRRQARLAERTREVVDRATRRWVWHESHAEDIIASRIGEVADGSLSPYDLAQEILAVLKEGAHA
jgi:LAO/AO transport system kinase